MKKKLYGVWVVCPKNHKHSMIRYGNYPVRGIELKREYGSAKLIDTKETRDEAEKLATDIKYAIALIEIHKDEKEKEMNRTNNKRLATPGKRYKINNSRPYWPSVATNNHHHITWNKMKRELLLFGNLGTPLELLERISREYGINLNEGNHLYINYLIKIEALVEA